MSPGSTAPTGWDGVIVTREKDSDEVRIEAYNNAHPGRYKMRVGNKEGWIDVVERAQ